MDLTPTPKIAPKSPKNAKKKTKIWPNEKQKDRAVLPKQKLIVYICRFQKCFRAWPRPQKQPQRAKKKITQKGSKSEKRPKIWPNLKQKDRAVLPKQKLIVYISRFQKCFWTWPRPKIQVSILSLNFKFQFQASTSSSNFRFQFKDSISSFNFKIQLQVSISRFNF